MAPTIYTALHGTTVSLSGQRGVFRICPRCNCAVGAIGPGTDRHPGQLACFGCGKHLSWVGARQMDALLAALARKGAA